MCEICGASANARDAARQCLSVDSTLASKFCFVLPVAMAAERSIVSSSSSIRFIVDSQCNHTRNDKRPKKKNSSPSFYVLFHDSMSSLFFVNVVCLHC
jgi:hypothetical protein